MKSQWKKTIELLKKAKTPLVVGHTNPEGDCIASTLAMGLVLRAMGADPYLYNADPLPYNLRSLPCSKDLHYALPAQGSVDLAVVVDCGDLARIGRGAVDFIGKLPIVNIDHHETNTLFGEANLVLPNASATGEVIFSFAKKAGVAVGPELATLMYAAILTDTGSFRYRNSTANAFEACTNLVELGAKPADIAFAIYEEQPHARLDLVARTLATLYVSPSGRFASVDLPQRAFAETGATLSMADGLVNFPRSLEGVEIALQFREREDGRWKVSFRSKHQVNVAAIAAAFPGGGGHEYAAGCDLAGSLDEVKATIFAAIQKALDAATARS